jgi:adenylate cyclase
MAALAPKLAERGLPPLNIGVGVNSGRMTVGDMGSQYRMAYTVMGDSVNTASRLEALTRRYGVGVIVGEMTRDDSRDAFLYRELDKVRPKGKSLPLTIFEPICRSQDATPELKQRVQLFHQALRYYRERNWDMAEIQLLNLQKQDPETELYQVYLDRIAAFRQEPPPDDWDGVYTLESK